MDEFRRTVGSRQPPIILAIWSDCWHKTNWATAHLNHVLSDSSEIGAELCQHGVGYRPDVLVELESKSQMSEGYFSWQPGQQEQSQGIGSEGKGTLLSLGDQSWFPLDKLTRSPKLNSTGRAAPLTLIQLTSCSVFWTLFVHPWSSFNAEWKSLTRGDLMYRDVQSDRKRNNDSLFKIDGECPLPEINSTSQLISFPFPTFKSTLLSLHQVWNHRDHNSAEVSREQRKEELQYRFILLSHLST